jgi:hypothetical protein
MCGIANISDNGGITVPPHPLCANPEAASGATLTDAATGGDETVTVDAGGLYAFTNRPAAVSGGTATDNTFVFGLATVLTAANVVWVCTPGKTILIQVPDDVTTLHYESLVNGGSGFLRKLK